MRQAAGRTTKSAISHNLMRDTRDDPFLATRGTYWRLAQEVAGFGGDAYHIKAEAESQMTQSLGRGYVRGAPLLFGSPTGR